ncbi:MAG: glycosyltransferase [Flavobacteriales bacterium]|nr:glycosyltransferase [Flavobacteriales bacterium]
MKISVVMVDGEFRENTYGAEYFSKQDFPEADYEVFWVEYYNQVPESVREQEKVTVITLGHSKSEEYHSSLCFNAGIKAAAGELVVIPDADQIVEPDFLSKLWEMHQQADNLVIYPYRYDELENDKLTNLSFEELKRKCVLRNPLNYGGCLSVRKKWLTEINGYEQHPFFGTGFHANGLDLYTRFKNLGLAVMWTDKLRLYHPWHPFTLADAEQYNVQKMVIDWRFRSIQYMALQGIDAARNADASEVEQLVKEKLKAQENRKQSNQGLVKKLMRKFS